MPTPILPDATLVVREALLAQPAVLSSEISDRIYLAVPDKAGEVGGPPYPMWVLTSIDDVEERPETLTCRVQVDVWGNGISTIDVAAAKASAAVLRSVARDLDGDWTAGKIRGCTPGTTLPSPDPDGRARFIVDLQFQLNQ